MSRLETTRAEDATVSVIIPTYNRGALIGEAIDSVLNQTHRELDIIVVDDGSDDDTVERLRAYGSSIRLVRTHHGGAAHARNAGVRAATGKYVAFLDSDDRYLPHKLALQVEVLERFSDIGLVYSEFSSFGDAEPELFHLRTYHAPAFRNRESYEHYFGPGRSLKEAGIVCEPWSERRLYAGQVFDHYLRVLFVFVNSMLVRRDILTEVGDHDERISLFDQYDLVLRIAKRYRLGFVDVPTYELRYHPGQISTTRRSDGPLVFVRKQQELLAIVERHAVHDRTYYESHKAEVNETMRRLHLALGIALMCHPGYEVEAREQFVACHQYGRRADGFWYLSWLPPICRRVAMKGRDLMPRWGSGS